MARMLELETLMVEKFGIVKMKAQTMPKKPKLEYYIRVLKST
jgi:hypothetical protein